MAAMTGQSGRHRQAGQAVRFNCSCLRLVGKEADGRQGAGSHLQRRT